MPSKLAKHSNRHGLQRLVCAQVTSTNSKTEHLAYVYCSCRRQTYFDVISEPAMHCLTLRLDTSQCTMLAESFSQANNDQNMMHIMATE